MTTWLDNLIPLKGRLNHLQLAGWKPGKVAAQDLGCRLLADVMIPMKDGTKLSADVYLPRKPGRYPAIVQFSAYNRDLHSIGVPKGTNEIGSPPVITARGYVQVVVTARGVGRSEGELRRWHAESEVQDHLACVAWAGEQDWSSGDVCLFGTSYYGMNQPTIAAHRPPALKAFFCNEICTDFRRHVFRYAGYPNIEFFGLWTGANFTAKGVKLYVPPVLRALLSHVVNRPFIWNLIRPRIDSVMQGFKKNRPVPRALENLVAFFTDTDTDPHNRTDEGSFRRLSQIDVPFVVVQNRGNISLHQFGAYDLPERRHAGRPQMADHWAGRVRASRLLLATRGTGLLRPCREGDRQRLRSTASRSLVARWRGRGRSGLGHGGGFPAPGLTHACAPSRRDWHS